jgi:transposase
MTVREEVEFLEPFFEKASTGHVATNNQIKRALEDRLGRKVHKTTVYRLLGRHGWRKIVPRPAHKQANEAEQEEFKKNSRRA